MSDPTRFSLLRRYNGFCYILYEKEGRRCWKSTRTRSKQDALRKLTHLKDLLKPRQRTILFSVFSRDFLSYAESTYSRPTTTMYRAALAKLKDVVGDLPLSSLSPRHVDTFKSERLKKVSPTSTNIELRTLKAAFNTALRWEVIEGSPFGGASLVNVPERPPAYFSREDLQKLLGVIREGWLKELVVFAVVTGMRRGEIVNLRWENVDLSRRVIYNHGSATFRTKHGKSRVVPVSETAYHLLSSKAGKSSADYVFTLNCRKIKEDWPSHKLKQYVYAAQLKDRRLHFHSLRHTFASWLVQDGAPLYEVQKLLGHSSSAVTQIYSHLQPEQLHETVNRIKISTN